MSHIDRSDLDRYLEARSSFEDARRVVNARVSEIMKVVDPSCSLVSFCVSGESVLADIFDPRMTHADDSIIDYQFPSAWLFDPEWLLKYKAKREVDEKKAKEILEKWQLSERERGKAERLRQYEELRKEFGSKGEGS